MSVTTREQIGNTLKSKFISHMKANGIVIPTTKLGDYFAPNGRMKKRNVNPQIGMEYEDDIDCTQMIGNQIPDELTWISECQGNLTLSNNSLTTLEGCPKTVLGDFILKENIGDLLLLGFPKQVGSDTIKSSINLSLSKITGLKYLPRTINGALSLAKCELASLEDCPQTINGDFNIQENELITTLEGGPKVVKGTYHCNYTSVKDFLHAPINPDFLGFKMVAGFDAAVKIYQKVESWAGFKPASDGSTSFLIKKVEEKYQEYLKYPPQPHQIASTSPLDSEIKFVKNLGTYLAIRKLKPELDTSIEAREEYAAYNPKSLEDFKSKSDTKQYEGVDINFIKMLKKALLK